MCQIIRPIIQTDAVPDFLWAHLNKDIDTLQISLDRSLDEVFMFLHSMIHSFVMPDTNFAGKIDNVILTNKCLTHISFCFNHSVFVYTCTYSGTFFFEINKIRFWMFTLILLKEIYHFFKIKILSLWSKRKKNICWLLERNGVIFLLVLYYDSVHYKIIKLSIRRQKNYVY